MVIASGNSNRHVNAIAQQVAEQAKRHGHYPLSEQGRENGEWALVDLGDIIIHVMQPQVREFYQLEKLWRPHAEIMEQQQEYTQKGGRFIIPVPEPKIV